MSLPRIGFLSHLDAAFEKLIFLNLRIGFGTTLLSDPRSCTRVSQGRSAAFSMVAGSRTSFGELAARLRSTGLKKCTSGNRADGR